MKHFTLYAFFLIFSFGVSAQNNVTFQVDMNQYSGSFTTPEVNGDFNGWCGNCNAMSDANSDGIWDVTLPLTQDSITYKFAHDNWGGQETLTPNTSCTKTTSGFTNRFIHINGDTTLPAVCWESCMECALPPDTSNVTFRVDMSQYTGTYTTPEVNGDFNGWCGNCNVMSDSNGDDIWEVTLPLTNDSIEYKFSFDNWAGQETLDSGIVCTKTTSGFTNRFKVLNGDVVLPAVCWEDCDECFVPVDSSLVTFRVDMSEYTGSYTTPELNGTFNGWCGNCNAMDDSDGDDIWEITVELPQDTVEYKFSFDNWTGQETLTEGDSCVLTTDGFTNRLLVITGDTTLPAVCWESCSVCPEETTGDTTTNVVNIASSAQFSLFPNPSSESFLINAKDWGSDNVEITVFNALGAAVYRTTNMNKKTEEIKVREMENGLYIISIESSYGRSVHRMMVSH